MPRTLRGNEALDGLQEYAHAQREEENAVEKSTKEPRSLPAEG